MQMSTQDARRLGAFFGKSDEKERLLCRALNDSATGRLTVSRFPLFSKDAVTISASLAGGNVEDLFECNTGLPISFAALLEFCFNWDRESIIALFALIEPGMKFDQLPSTFLRAWFGEKYKILSTPIVDQSITSLIHAWSGLDKEGGTSSYTDLDKIITRLQEEAKTSVVIKPLFALLRDSIPIDPYEVQWMQSLLSNGVRINWLEAGLMAGMSIGDLDWEDFRAQWFDVKTDPAACSNLDWQSLKVQWDQEHGQQNARYEELLAASANMMKVLASSHKDLLFKILAANSQN